MSLSDEDKRTIRAMQLLGFSFPPNLERTMSTIEELPVEYMLQIRAVFKEKFSMYSRAMDNLHERITHTYCDICDEDGWSYDDLPDGWGWIDGQVRWYIMCLMCQSRYADKFNELPVIVRDLENKL